MVIVWNVWDMALRKVSRVSSSSINEAALILSCGHGEEDLEELHCCQLSAAYSSSEQEIFNPKAKSSNIGLEWRMQANCASSI